MGIPPAFHDRSFDNYEASNEIVDLVDKFFKDPFNLLIYGPPGVGKTHLIVAMFKAAIYYAEGIVGGEQGPLFVVWRSLVDDYKDGFSTNTAESRLQEYLKAQILFLDDITTNVTDMERNLLGKIIATRYDQNKYLVTTSNDGPERLMLVMGQHEASRFSSRLVKVHIAGRDRRND